VLHYNGAPAFETARPLAALRRMTRPVDPAGAGEGLRADAEALRGLASRSDLVRAILVSDNDATDPAGRTQRLDAWAVEWQASSDPDTAYAGRSLLWWDKTRREGDAPVLLAWLLDPAPAGAAGNRLRMPALYVCQASSR
jgi:hypothetical protein